jgi:hypothetical protein
MFYMVDIVKTLQEAEEIRVRAAGDVSGNLEQTRTLYLKAIDKIKRITSQFTPESVVSADQQTKIGVGQAEWSIATIYTSLAKHGAQNDQEISQYLKLAQEQLDSPLLEAVLPTIEKINLSATNDPLLWGAEIARIKARIEERQPNASPENLAKAIEHYSTAVDYSYDVYFSAVSQENRSLQLAALSSYATALGERARIRSKAESAMALQEMSVAASIIEHIYTELPNFDRYETVLGRIIDYCVENQISENHPTFQQAIVLYIELSKITESKERFLQRLEKIKKNGSFVISPKLESAFEAISH